MKVNERAAEDEPQSRVGARAGDTRVRVLLSLDPPDGTTRYVDQIASHIPDNVELVYFSWATALFGRYDVFHVHWPEFLLRAASPRKTRAKHMLAGALLRRLRRRNTAVVRTLHNTTPHEGLRAEERKFVDALAALTTVYVRLNRSTQPPVDTPCETVMHGDYVQRFAPFAEIRSAPRPGVLLSAGLLRPYKGVLELIEAMRGVQSGLTLRIVGKPVDAGFRKSIEAAAQSNPHIFMHFGFLPDRQLVDEILAAECVVLPYRVIHNSGMLLVALSLGRPVLVPRSDTTEEMQREVGVEWIQMFDGAIDADAIDRAVELFRTSSRSTLPTFDGRDWQTVGRRHTEVYATAVDAKRAGVVADAEAAAV